MYKNSKQILGVLGGMGPVASAEFIRTVYEQGIGEREQEALKVFLYSDPSFPDRTDAFLAGEYEEILRRLVDALNLLRDAGASEIVICCMTIHYLLPRLEADLRKLIISMLDLIFSGMKQSNQRHLLICSTGARKLKLFESHDDWEVSSKAFVLPDLADQERIHRDLIYPIKRHADFRELFRLLETLLEKYGVSSFIVGCSEVHLLAKRFLAEANYRDRYDCIDPFTSVVRQIMQKAT